MPKVTVPEHCESFNDLIIKNVSNYIPMIVKR